MNARGTIGNRIGRFGRVTAVFVLLLTQTVACASNASTPERIGKRSEPITSVVPPSGQSASGQVARPPGVLFPSTASNQVASPTNFVTDVTSNGNVALEGANAGSTRSQQ